MGHTVDELRRLRSVSIGTEVGKDARDDREVQWILSELKLRPKLAAKQEAVLAHYIDDIRRAVTEVGRVLAVGGRAVYVVGENTVRGTFIRNSVIVEAVACIAGLHRTARRSRKLPEHRRYLPPPLTQPGAVTRIRREVILTFKKATGPDTVSA